MQQLHPSTEARAIAPRRWAWLGVTTAAALLLHWAALSGIDWAWPSQQTPTARPSAVQVRVVDAAPIAAVPAVVPLPARPPALRAAAKGPTPIVPKATAAPPRAPDDPIAVAQPPALSTPTALSPPATAVTANDEPIPHYRTRMPPAITLRYELHRGLLRGTSNLSWRPQGEHYELQLEASVAGVTLIRQASMGGFDADGLAPERFTDQRLRRATTAANFQRAAGKISFSGPPTEFALREGAQDRLSWMVQLAAIVAAEPPLSAPGAKVVMVVVGSHGDAGVWVFRCLGPEVVAMGAGTAEAIKFMREPRETYDTTVEVWLDPQRHALPVRAVQKSGPNDDGFDLRLQEVISPN